MKALHPLLGAVVAVTLAAGATTAQETPPDSTAPRARMRVHAPGTGLREGVTPRHRRIGERGRMDGFGFASPGALLRQRELLGLSDEQVASLEQLDSELRAQHEESAAALRTRQEELREAWRSDEVDADLIKRKTTEVMEARNQLELARLDAGARARGLLSNEQLGKVRGFQEGVRRGAAMRGNRTGEGGRFGMRRSPGRRGGSRSFRSQRY